MRDAESSESEGTTVRPHVRRAHWHSYWRGKLGDRRRILGWISPLLINGDEAASPTIRRVDGRCGVVK